MGASRLHGKAVGAMKPHFLFHRPTPWDSDIRCSTKVLARLTAEAGCTVTYLEAPYDPINLLRGRPRTEGQRHDDGIRILTPRTPVPVRDVWPLSGKRAAGLRYALARPSIAEAVAAGGRGRPDVVWTTVPGSGRALRRLFPRARLVFHVVDYYPAFRGDAVQALEREDYAVADDIMTIGHGLSNYLIETLGVPSGKITVMGQGVDVALYRGVSGRPEDIRDLPRPLAVWVGVLAKGDPDLFRAAADAARQAGGSIVLIGPRAGWADALERDFPHVVRCLGSRPPEAIPAYLVAADAGLMLYARDRETVYRGQNPLKLYEYAAAGLSIVSTPHDEYAHLDPPVVLVSSPDEARAATLRVLTEGKSPSAASLDFARRHDWRAMVASILGRFGPADPAVEPAA